MDFSEWAIRGVLGSQYGPLVNILREAKNISYRPVTGSIALD